MKSFFTWLLLSTVAIFSANAQTTAKVQLIHNSPDQAVDIYLNGFNALNDVAFRTATTLLDLPAGLPLDIAVAPSNSTSAADAFANFNYTLDAGRTYIMTAIGVRGNATTPFTVLNDANGRSDAPVGKVGISVIQGAPDAPAYDMVIRTGSKVVANLAYGQFTPYFEIPNGDYFIDLKLAGQNNIQATYRMDLTGMSGKSGKIMTSGYLGGGTPSFGVYAIWTNGQVDALPLSPVARVQLIQNAPGQTLDVYKNGGKFADDMEFRKAKEYFFIPAGSVMNIGIANASSTSVNDTLVNIPYTFENGKTYTVVASGIQGNATTPLTMFFNDTGREKSLDTNVVDMAFFHGMPDAPAGDIDILWVANNVVQGLSYGEFSNYISLSPDVYHFSLRAAGSPVSSGLRRADFSALKGKSAHLFFSGLINGNSDWGLYAALADGTVIEIPQESTTRVQFIQNSPGAPVDIYAGATKWLDDFTFRTATPFMDVPADQSINIGVAPANSTSSANAFANFQTTFSSSKKYTVFASGVKGNPAKPFVLQVFDDALETSLLGQVSVSAMHGSPDAPAVDVAERTLGLLFSDLSYGEQSAYTDVPGTVLFLDLKPTGQDQILQTYMADLSGLSGQALRIFASGYLNAGIPPLGLFAALPDGTVNELPVFPVARVQFLNNSPTETRDIYTFDDLAFDDFAFRTATGYTYVPAGFPIPFGVAPSGSASVSDAIYTQNISFANGGTYVVVLSGQNGNTQAPLSFIVKGNAHESALSPDALEIAVVHGVPDMPTVNLASVLNGSNFLSDLHYGQISNYVSVGDPGFVLLDVLNAADLRKVYGVYGGDFTGTGGISLVLFASGLLNAPDDESKFGLFLMLPDGIVLPMPSFARAQLIHNAPDAPVDLWYSDEFTPDGVLVAENVEFRSATGFGFYPAAGAFDLSVAPAGSTSIDQSVYTQSFFLDTQKEYTFMAAGIVGNAATPFQFYVDENARRFAENVNQVDVNFFHGAPGAPGVDVNFIGSSLFDNVAYGQFAPYQNVPPSTYLVELSVAGTGNPIGRYEAALGALTGQALTVFASGYLNQSPGLELWAAEPDGSTYPLPIISATNDVLETIQNLSLAPNPVSDEMVVSFEMKNTSPVRFQVLDMTGRNVMEGNWGELGGNNAQRIPVAHLPNGIYQLQVMIPEGSLSVRFAVQR